MGQKKRGNGGTALEKANAVRQAVVAAGSRAAEILPRHMSPERFIRLAKLVVAQDSKILNCDPLTVAGSILDAARLGLEIGREAHLVPFGETCQLIPDYRGYQVIASRSGKVDIIEARIVYDGDEFDWEEGSNPFIKHRPAPDVDRGDGNVLWFYAIAFLSNGRSTFIVRSPEEIERVRAMSRMKDGQAWKGSWQKMGMKTVIRELCDKRLTFGTELGALVELDNRADTGQASRPLEWEDEQEIRNRVKRETEARMDEMKARMAQAEPAEAEVVDEDEDEQIRREEMGMEE